MNKKSGRAALVLLADRLTPIALQALHNHADLTGAPCFGFGPGPLLPGRIVAHMLAVPASETGDPVAILVPLETDNTLLQTRNDSPQPHSSFTFGLLKRKPSFSPSRA